MSFASLGLSAPILKAVTEKGYTTPSPIQLQAIPAVAKGLDVMAAAQTGTGKTAGFVLPILERLAKGSAVKANNVRTLILTPTRELAAQVAESVVTYSKHLPIRSTVVFGGVKINPQMMQLRPGVDILVATPGRLLDLYNQRAVKFSQVEILVLDEADRMLDMGFINDIRKILALLPKARQNLMFSATFSDNIRSLAKGFLTDPVEISVSPRNTTAQSVTQWICPVDKKQKPRLLAHLILENKWEQVLVFTQTKHGANKLTKFLELNGINAAAIHGNKSQGARTKALADFKKGTTRVLVATDIAARGLDIDQLPHVVNFDLPKVAEDYVHRIGRTGRAAYTGEAVSLVCADEIKLLSDIERLIQKLLPRTLVDGFEPEHDVPESRLNSRPASPKKPNGTAHRGRDRGEQAQPGNRSRRNNTQSSASNQRDSNSERPSRGESTNNRNGNSESPYKTASKNNTARPNRAGNKAPVAANRGAAPRSNQRGNNTTHKSPR